MPKSYIVDASAFDQPADIKPGIYSADIFDKTMEMPEEKSPTIGERIGKAAEYLPTAGALAGGVASALAAPGTAGASLLGGSALAGLGAAAGKAGEQIVKRAVGQETPKTATEAAKQIGKEGAWTAGTNLALGKLIPFLKPALQKVAPQVLKVFQGIDEKMGAKVIRDPDILFRAKPMEVAKKEFADFFEKNGFKYGPKSVKASTGKIALADNAADDFISDAIGDIELLKAIPNPTTQETNQVIQKALDARFSIGDAIGRATRSGNANKARVFINAKNEVDDWLETQIPGFSKARSTYEEAKIKEAFSTVFPRNKNATASVLRGFAAATAGLLNPISAAAMSPIAGGKIIQAGALAATKPGMAAISEMAGKKAESLVEKGADMEREDHPQLSQPQAEEIAAQEVAKDKKGYAAEINKRTHHHVKADYKAGYISKEQALKELREQHGFE